MKCILNKLVVNGAKNIDKPIILFFTNKTIDNKFENFSNSVKAIYGPNGAGKSGIMAAMYIYKRIGMLEDGLTDKVFSNFVNETINKKLNSLSIEVTFSLTDWTKSKRIFTYRHEIELSKNNNGIFINREILYKLTGQSIATGSFKPLIIISNGNLQKIGDDNNFQENILYKKSLNLLNKNSIVSIFSKLALEIKNKAIHEEIVDDVSYALIGALAFNLRLIVEIDEQDMHIDYISNSLLTSNDDANLLLTELARIVSKFKLTNNYLFVERDNKDLVPPNKYKKYEQNIIMLSKFIKIFKPSLNDIIIEKKINKNVYYCEKIFKYNDYSINFEFESTGVKKLVKLFYSLHDCANGDIVFIDEMDANLHDVYFNKLIEFFVYDSKGQLCFTTHNLSPIKLLKEYPHSLDFLSNDSRVYSWKKEGNTSPIAKYIDGLIPFSSFNVEFFDFDILLDK